MPVEFNRNSIADVTILSNMMAETEIGGEKYYACNWKEWMSEHSACSADNILVFAQSEIKEPSGPYAKNWQSLIDYSPSL